MPLKPRIHNIPEISAANQLCSNNYLSICAAGRTLPSLVRFLPPPLHVWPFPGLHSLFSGALLRAFTHTLQPPAQLGGTTSTQLRALGHGPVLRARRRGSELKFQTDLHKFMETGTFGLDLCSGFGTLMPRFQESFRYYLEYNILFALI